MNTETNANANALIIKEKLFIKADLTRLEEYVIKNEPMIKRNARYYPNPNHCSTIIETDEELFNNLFDVQQIYRINRFKKYALIFIFLGVYALIGYMYYKFIYIN
jgi:hypothetical protein